MPIAIDDRFIVKRDKIECIELHRHKIHFGIRGREVIMFFNNEEQAKTAFSKIIDVMNVELRVLSQQAQCK